MLQLYKKTILRMHDQLHELKHDPMNNRAICHGMQKTIIKKIIHIEKRIRILKSTYKNIKTKLRTKNENSKTESINLKNSMKSINYDIDSYQKLLHVFRTFGDGLAHCYINRWDIKTLSFNENAGAISDKDGFTHEYKAFVHFNNQGMIVIFNDITNCLRHGDLTLINDINNWSGIEIKSGPNLNQRGKRQFEKYKKLSNYFINDRVEYLYPEVPVMHREELMLPEKSLIEELNAIIGRALIAGYEGKEVEPGLFYFCSITETLYSPIFPDWHSDAIAITCFLNEYKYEAAPYYYPICLAIEHRDAFFRYLEGSLFIFVILNMKVVQDFFDKQQINVIYEDDSIWALTIAAKESNNKFQFQPFCVSASYFSRIFLEFFSLEWFMSELLLRLTSPQKVLNENSIIMNRERLPKSLGGPE